jgi:hypothetical protein
MHRTIKSAIPPCHGMVGKGKQKDRACFLSFLHQGVVEKATTDASTALF